MSRVDRRSCQSNLFQLKRILLRTNNNNQKKKKKSSNCNSPLAARVQNISQGEQQAAKNVRSVQGEHTAGADSIFCSHSSISIMEDSLIASHPQPK